MTAERVILDIVQVNDVYLNDGVEKRIADIQGDGVVWYFENTNGYPKRMKLDHLLSDIADGSWRLVQRVCSCCSGSGVQRFD